MNLAKVSCNGQVTLPVEIRRELKIKSGDKIIFLRKNNGEIIVQNLESVAMVEVQRAVSHTSA